MHSRERTTEDPAGFRPRDTMDLTRRRLLAASGASVAGFGVLGYSRGELWRPYRSSVTSGVSPTTEAYVTEAEALDEHGALASTLWQPGEPSTVHWGAMPGHVVRRMAATTRADAFWTITVAVLPPDVTFSLDTVAFDRGTLTFETTAKQSDLGGGKPAITPTDEKRYRYQFDKWVPTVPFASPPDEVRVRWTADPVSTDE